MLISISSSRRALLSTLFCGFLFGLLLAAPPAFADEDREFQEHYQRGLQLYKLNFLRQAVKEFIAAYAANPLPRLLYNMGQLQRKIGDYREASESYELYLRTESDITPERRAEVQRYIDALRTPGSSSPASAPTTEPPASVPGVADSGNSSDAPTLLMILPPSASGKAGRYMFNLFSDLPKKRTIPPASEAGVNRARCRSNPFDGHLHLALGTRWAHGPSFG